MFQPQTVRPDVDRQRCWPPRRPSPCSPRPPPPRQPPDDDSRLDVIIITANQREEDLQDVPVSAATLPQDQIEAIFASGEDVLALAARVPALYAESSNGRVAPRFYIRGLGNTDFDLAASQPVSIIMDDVVMENVVLKVDADLRRRPRRGLSRPAGHAVRPQHHRRHRALHLGQADRGIRRPRAGLLRHARHR